MKYTALGTVKEGKVGVAVAVPEPGGRGIGRVELDVYGARYPYKLSPAEALELSELLSDAAKAVATSGWSSPV